ncbi:YfcE family phosphodiesterase [Methanothermococcus okinawensis]|uniref:Phosphoesterase n=1 Tax=Methanothermococcus okinawensis (strain DSM 14208 / JCM 11175 / IH1) TaxID=647113 RepID=F8AN79_METOI|nr:YfcE family phosphodiesterase [Methanothermococcus okinawensis]AEH06996.1 phosphodiesterase, MJ0936 family [Methanothermococcus okinawensis IH1]
MIIGVISDTHIGDRADKLPKEIEDKFSNVDLIIHCGDITSKSVLNELNDIANTIAVKGNMDYLELPREEILNINNFKIGIIHGDIIHPRGDLLKMKYYSLEKGLDVLISGHTHVPLIKEIEISELNKKILLLNPGSPTVPRFPLKTIMKIEIENNTINPKLIPIINKE